MTTQSTYKRLTPYDVRCSVCGSNAGISCSYVGGTVKFFAHDKRRFAAEQANQISFPQ